MSENIVVVKGKEKISNSVKQRRKKEEENNYSTSFTSEEGKT